MAMRSFSLGVLALVLTGVACGGAATPSVPPATAPATESATATAAATTMASAGPVAAGKWTVRDTSKATVRVREQLVGVSAPSDAVLVATGATGAFELRSDGTFSPDSKITFDLTTLASDQRDRDNFIRRDTLRVQQFPKAEIVPTRVTGTVPASGDFTLTLTGNVTIRGTTKSVTFDVQGKRDGASLTATATANPSFKFGDFGMTAPSVPFRVVSLVDEIRLAVDLVATAAS